jgi:ribonuclease PH
MTVVRLPAAASPGCHDQSGGGRSLPAIAAATVALKAACPRVVPRSRVVAAPTCHVVSERRVAIDSVALVSEETST